MNVNCHQDGFPDSGRTVQKSNYHQEQYTKHVKKYGIDSVSFGKETTVVDRSKCSKCDLLPKYECNLLGRGKFLCFGHAQRFLDKNSSLLADFWFVIPLISDLQGENKEVESKAT
uniref:Uncharacterized protein n=1 Tax=Pithovirus LCPAC202 TaxID=2506592 RepID=A0A481Z674_9VIRU|nr:MAG: hypothetical protein LCPAC202_02410 [Pithovirus LCPAC202]